MAFFFISNKSEECRAINMDINGNESFTLIKEDKTKWKI